MLLAGSATPRPESMLRYERIVLPERVDGRRLPPVELVGMAERRRRRCTSARARRSRRSAAREEKAIVLLNRRGWSNFLSLPRLRRGSGSARTAT